MPIRDSGDPEDKLNYFKEDTGLNIFHKMFHVVRRNACDCDWCGSRCDSNYHKEGMYVIVIGVIHDVIVIII